MYILEIITFRYNINQFPKQLWQRDTDVSSVGASVFRCQPDLDDALLEGLDGAGDDLVGRIGAQIASGVLGLAIRALVQTSRVDGDDLDERILADLREIESSSAGFTAVSRLLLIH